MSNEFNRRFFVAAPDSERARALVTDAIVAKAARVEWDVDHRNYSRWPGFDDDAHYETDAREYEPAMRAALEAVICDLVGAVRIADWDGAL